LQVIIVVLLQIDPTPNEFVEAAVINTAIIVIDGVRAVIKDLDFLGLRQSCNSFKISLSSLLFHSGLS
jgi:hypothetical protein